MRSQNLLILSASSATLLRKVEICSSNQLFEHFLKSRLTVADFVPSNVSSFIFYAHSTFHQVWQFSHIFDKFSVKIDLIKLKLWTKLSFCTLRFFHVPDWSIYISFYQQFCVSVLTKNQSEQPNFGKFWNFFSYPKRSLSQIQIFGHSHFAETKSVWYCCLHTKIIKVLEARRKINSVFWANDTLKKVFWGF